MAKTQEQLLESMRTNRWIWGEDVLAFTQLMFVMARAMGTHPWDMQEMIDRHKDKRLGIVKYQPLEEAFENAKEKGSDLPNFDEILAKLAWIGAAPDDAGEGDRYWDRVNVTVREWKKKYVREGGSND